MVIIFEEATDLVGMFEESFRLFRSEPMFDAKSLFKNLGNDALKVAPGALGVAFGPAAAALATFASNAIMQAEAKHTAAANVGVAPAVLNEAKKNDVVSALEEQLPAIISMLPKTDVPVDSAQVSDGIGRLVDSFVAILKGTGHLPSAPPKATLPTAIAIPLPVASLTDAAITDRGADGSMTLSLVVHIAA